MAVKSADAAPSTNGSNGRGPSGQFAKGWKGGPGNPHASKVASLRSAFLKTFTEKDMQDVAFALLQLAKSGNVQAITLLCQRAMGAVVPQEIDAEASVGALSHEQIVGLLNAQRKAASPALTVVPNDRTRAG